MPSAQTPMISAPLKQTSEVDWIGPLKSYIRSSYGDDPDRYSEECATLNRLRQDMRGAGRDSASGRDLLYRYYGQLELLDLRFPVDENHVKVQFTWFDAFTHKSTSQYSLAFEKASIIFNISAVLSCHAANQNRHDETGLKTAYHSFQASAGMFTYINDNFLHAPSTDLSRDTVKTLVSVMLAQAQEVFLEKQIQDGKKSALLAKLASQAHNHYSAAVEGVTDNVNKQIFERVWLLLVQIKLGYMGSLAQYYQAIADEDADEYGSAIARLKVAENMATEASRVAASFPSSVPATSNLGADTGNLLKETVKRHLVAVQEKLASVTKDNDFIYHQSVPTEAALSVVAKLPAAKAIPVTELYQGQDIQRIIGPDIFQKIVPIAVTESASLYDEEKAKLVRSENEKVEQANDEMATSLDYLKLPGSLNVVKGGMEQEVTVDEEFRSWCEELAGHEPFNNAFDRLQTDKAGIVASLDSCSKQLDMEENICEKMRVKYSSDWTQQPSSRLNATLRSDLQSYRGAIDEAAGSDAQLLATSRQYDADFEELRSAGETDEADILYQQAMVKNGAKGKGTPKTEESNLLDEDYGEGGTTVTEQIQHIEDLLKKLNSIKRDRQNFLKELKERAHNDDISNVLILNKKQLASHEQQLFQSELEKFRPYQNRLLQSQHKQTSVLKDLTRSYGDLLQDPRVRSEQAKFETFQRQRGAVLTKYRKVYQAFTDLVAGLSRAQSFYSDMKATTENLRKNVETFVNNRREEGGQLLSNIENKKQSSASNQADKQGEQLRDLMDRMALKEGSNDGRSPSLAPRPGPQPSNNNPASLAAGGVSYPYPTAKTPTSFAGSPAPGYPSPSPVPVPATTPSYASYLQHLSQQSHPLAMGQQPPIGMHQQYQHAPYDYPPYQHAPPQHQQQQQHQHQQQHQQPQHPQHSGSAQQQRSAASPPGSHMYPSYAQQLPQGYVPPPPPPGGPPPGQQYGYVAPQQGQPPGQSPGQQDPWAGLGQWK